MAWLGALVFVLLVAWALFEFYGGGIDEFLDTDPTDNGDLDQ